jgi:hypothetical protein
MKQEQTFDSIMEIVQTPAICKKQGGNEFGFFKTGTEYM